VLQVILLVLVFFGTWHRWNLIGTVAAYGLALVISYAMLMAIALKTAPFFPSIAELWFKAALVQTAVAAVAIWWMPLGPLTALVIWFAGLTVFLWASHYDLRELKLLAGMFMPGSAALLADVSEAPVLTGVRGPDAILNEQRASSHL
jgi:hypothetical protein